MLLTRWAYRSPTKSQKVLTSKSRWDLLRRVEQLRPNNQSQRIGLLPIIGSSQPNRQDYTVTISDQDGQTAMKEGKGFLWTWQFNTTYNWNSISVITKTDTRAYTQDIGHFPRCYPNWGTDDTYQSCVEGGDLPEASMGSDAVV